MYPHCLFSFHTQRPYLQPTPRDNCRFVVVCKAKPNIVYCNTTCKLSQLSPSCIPLSHAQTAIFTHPNTDFYMPKHIFSYTHFHTSKLLLSHAQTSIFTNTSKDPLSHAQASIWIHRFSHIQTSTFTCPSIN